MAVSALLLPFRHGDDQDRLRGLARAVDFGMSVGGFATLGAWTAHRPWRPAVRVVVGAYLLGALLAEGLIHDLTHPAGWAIGLVVGAYLSWKAVQGLSPDSFRYIVNASSIERR